MRKKFKLLISLLCLIGIFENALLVSAEDREALLEQEILRLSGAPQIGRAHV